MTPNPAALTAFLSGGGLIALIAWVWWRPEAALTTLRAYPRTVWPGRILAAITLVWFARNLWMVDLGGFSSLKPLLFVLAPAGIGLVVILLDDLLSVRGLCGLILLAAQPLLVWIRWTGTPASFVMALFVYALVLTSMVLMVYPHLWIRGMDRWKDGSPWRKPAMGVAVAVAGALVGSGLLSL